MDPTLSALVFLGAGTLVGAASGWRQRRHVPSLWAAVEARFRESGWRLEVADPSRMRTRLRFQRELNGPRLAVAFRSALPSELEDWPEVSIRSDLQVRSESPEAARRFLDRHGWAVWDALRGADAQGGTLLIRGGYAELTMWEALALPGGVGRCGALLKAVQTWSETSA